MAENGVRNNRPRHPRKRCKPDGHSEIADCGHVRRGFRAAGVNSRQALTTRPYCLGETRVATLALLTFTALSGWCPCGVVTTQFSGHVVTFRSSPTVFADTPIPGIPALTRILLGKPPRVMWSAAILFGLYRITAPHYPVPTADCRETAYNLSTLPANPICTGKRERIGSYRGGLSTAHERIARLRAVIACSAATMPVR